LDAMKTHRMDFTNTFRTLSDESAITTCPFGQTDLTEWHGRWQERLKRQPQNPDEAAQRMRDHNPAVIPRNDLVEQALTAATEGDLGVMNRLLSVLARPYASGHPTEYTSPAPAGSPRYQTFCGT
jgi:serine/tyrosine/threonine adenylyltransferase